MTTPINTKLSVLHSSDGLVDLYVVDASALGGSVYHFSPQSYSDGSLLTWGGQAYNLCPIGIDGFEVKSDASSFPRPTLTINNTGGGPLLSAVSALGDLVGATVTHYVTKVSYLDGQSDASTSEYKGPFIWRIISRAMDNQTITFTLADPLDLQGMMFPIRQILIDQGVNQPDGIYFPGVAPYRTSQWQSQ